MGGELRQVGPGRRVDIAPDLHGVAAPTAAALPEMERIHALQRAAGNRATGAFLAAAQTKLAVGAADDPCEREADDVARDVVARLRANTPRNTPHEGSGPTSQNRAWSRVLRRASPPTGSHAIGLAGGELHEGAEAQVDAVRGGGSPLPTNLRRSMEGAFGAEFAGVRIHRGSGAASLNRTMGAAAFTVGSDIFLGSRTGSLESPAGESILAHELTHTIQQGAAGLRTPHDGGGDVDGPDGVAVVHRSTEERGISRLLQRKVGFEFEDAHWRVWKKQPAVPGPGDTVSPVARKDKVHNGAGFALEADDTNGATQPSLEFVTEPFDTDIGGQAALKAALAEIGTIIVGRLGPKKGKGGPPTGGAFPKPYVATDYVDRAEHQLNGGDFGPDDVLFSGGDSAGKFKMQATMSTDMAQMSKAMTYFGSQVQGETAGGTKRREPARRLMSGKDSPTDAPSKVLGNSPRLGAAVVTEIQRVFQSAGSPLLEHVQGDTTEMAAFFAFVILYVKMLQLPVDGVLKYRIPFLARRSFVTMFQAIPDGQREVLSGDDGAVMKDAIMTVSNANPLISKTQGQMPDTALTLDTPLVNALRSPSQGGGKKPAVRMPVHDRLAGITIGVWLTEITKGRDLLTPTDCGQWLRNNAAGLGRKKRTEAVELLESFASLDENPPADALPPAVFENRAIAPNLEKMSFSELNFYEVSDMAKQYLDFFVNLAARPTRPGKFPEKKT